MTGGDDDAGHDREPLHHPRGHVAGASGWPYAGPIAEG